MAQSFDIIVAGAGPVGQIAAISLARAGFSVALAGPRAAGDRRTTALMRPALDTLQDLAIGPLHDAIAAPLRSMRIVDGTRRLIRSAPVTFHASEIGESEFGFNIPNAELQRLLDVAVKTELGIARFEQLVNVWRPGNDANDAVLTDGNVISAKLTVAADGRNSSARAAAGISAQLRPLPQSALVLNFAHSRPHGSVSTEFHTESGPFTVVPLPGQRSSLVWVVRPEKATQLSSLSRHELSGLVETQLQSILGSVEVEEGFQVFPLGSLSASSLAAQRTALIGEAAHVLPPIGAQGMNLGIRDVVDLTRIVSAHTDDPGGEKVLSAYRSARRMDVLARASAVDVLNRSLLSEFLPAQFLRGAGLAALGVVAPLRAFVMREGMLPGSGWSGIGSSVRKKVGRQDA